MKRSYIKYLAIVYLVTFAADWLVQMIYYYYESSVNPHAFFGLRTLYDYQTGFIGDTIIVPIMNVMILFTFLVARFKPSIRALSTGALIGFLCDLFVHFMQGELKLVNWSMPKPFEWNTVSYWHMVSFFFQLTFIALFFILLVGKKPKRAKHTQLFVGITSVLALMVVFIAMFWHDYHNLFSLQISYLTDSLNHWLWKT